MSDSQLDQLLAQQHQQQDIVDVDEPVIKLVIFTLGDYYFALPGSVVKEVLPGDETVFFVPGLPASVEGMINLRGDVKSVIGLYALLQLQSSLQKQSMASSAILIIHGQHMRSAVRVDRLLDVVDIAQSQIHLPPDSLPEHLRPYVTGLLQFDDVAVSVLSIDELFSAWLQGQG